MTDSAKHIIQILELLNERKMNYTFLMSKTELLLSSGFSLLWQCFELSQDSKLAQDNQKSLKALTTVLMGDSLSIAVEFQGIARAFMTPILSSPPSIASPSQLRTNFVCDRSAMPAPGPGPKSARRQLQAIASRFSSLAKPHQPRTEDVPRRATVPGVSPNYLSSHHRTSSQLSLSSTRSLPVFSINSPPTTRTFMDLPPSTVNLDYFPLGEDYFPGHSNPARKEALASFNVDWSPSQEGMDTLTPNMFDGLYNGLQDQISQSCLDLDVSTLTNPQDWLNQEWPVSAIDLSAKGPVPQSLLSASGESITSGGEEFSGCGSNDGSTSSALMDHHDTGGKTFPGITMPTFEEATI
jgi:hypothetical protein